jgi:uncharacterized protein YdeI (YjbR/CyaY-like superfamily)
MDSQVDEYMSKLNKWEQELGLLRHILLDCDLVETFKWRGPCYTLGKANVLFLGSFKNYAALSFFKGVLLADEENLLHKPGENSQTVRLFKFTSPQQILEIAPVIKAYIYEAIEIEKAGLKVALTESKDLKYPEELIQKMDELPEFKTAFQALTPGRQRGYNMHFTAAKQSATRIARIEKYLPRILRGKGINDCVCGLSKRMPACDGSHKFL